MILAPYTRKDANVAGGLNVSMFHFCSRWTLFETNEPFDVIANLYFCRCKI